MSTRISKSRASKTAFGFEPRKQPVQTRSKETVQVILTAATQVFHEHGYAAGTTNRIAKRAGVSIGTVYQYFPNKEAIVIALFEQHITEMKEKLKSWVAQIANEPRDLQEILNLFVEKIIETHAEQPGLLNIFFEETSIPSRILDLILRVEIDMARTLLGAMGRHPEIGRTRLNHAAVMVVQTVTLLTHRHIAYPDRVLNRKTFTTERASHSGERAQRKPTLIERPPPDDTR